MIDCAIGVDVGGTKCACGIVRLVDGHIVARDRFPTRPDRGGEAVLNDVIGAIESLRELAHQQQLRPTQIGIGLAELVGRDNCILSDATIAWKSLSVTESLTNRFQLPLCLDADVRAAARAEARWGAGRCFDPFLYVTVGTGIAACLVIDGQPYVGARGLTGTFASSRQLIPADNDQLVSGPPLEAYAGGPALVARYRKIEATFDGDAAKVVMLAEQGDPEAVRIVRTAGRALGASIGQLVNITDPQSVILGGGLGLAQGNYRDECEAAMRASVWSDVHRDLPLVNAALGNDAGWVGAAIAGYPPTR